MLRFHPEEEGVIVCTDEKGSLLVRKGKPFCYRREELEIVYLPEISNPFGKKKDEKRSKDECEAWLWKILDHAAIQRATIMEMGRDAGFSSSLIYEAKASLGLAYKNQPAEGRGQPKVWWARQGFKWGAMFDEDDPYA